MTMNILQYLNKGFRISKIPRVKLLKSKSISVVKNIFALLIFMIFLSNSTLANNNDSLQCRFYSFNETIFQVINDSENLLEFHILGLNISNDTVKFSQILYAKKGITSIAIIVENQNKVNIQLKTTKYFDALYLRHIVERNFKINKVFVNDVETNWDDFVSLYLKNNSRQ